MTTLILFVVMLLITAAVAIYTNHREAKEAKAHNDAMRPLYTQKAERRNQLPKAVVSRQSPYYPVRSTLEPKTFHVEHN